MPLNVCLCKVLVTQKPKKKAPLLALFSFSMPLIKQESTFIIKTNKQEKKKRLLENELTMSFLFKSRH